LLFETLALWVACVHRTNNLSVRSVISRRVAGTLRPLAFFALIWINAGAKRNKRRAFGPKLYAMFVMRSIASQQILPGDFSLGSFASFRQSRHVQLVSIVDIWALILSRSLVPLSNSIAREYD
jgi:hypothetical protein